MTDAELVTLAVAQAMTGIAHDNDFLAAAQRQLRHLFARLPQQPGYRKRRQRLANTIEWPIGVLAQRRPGVSR